MNKKFTLIIAAFNSQQTIRSVVEEAIFALNKIYGKDEFELIIVEDGSVDDTWGELKEISASYSNVRGVRLSRNFGQQSAMMAGFSLCESDLVGYCDDDGQSPVCDIGKILEEINNKPVDMIWAKYENKKKLGLGGLGRFINELMLRAVYEKPKELEFGNMWVARKFIIDQLRKNNSPILYLGGAFLEITKNMSNINLVKRERKHGKSGYSLMKLLGLFVNGLIYTSIAPLRIALILGCVLAFSGIIIALLISYVRLTNAGMPVGYASIASLILILGGTQLILAGVIGEYIGRIFIHVSGKPQFVISELSDE